MEIVRATIATKVESTTIFSVSKAVTLLTSRTARGNATQPLIRRNSKLTPATWEEAFALIGKRFAEVRDRDGGAAIGVIDRLATNEENYLLSKFARVAQNEQCGSSPHRRLCGTGWSAAWQARTDCVDARSV
jgi:anaerobic selenocysteine-containing dehydrogenase